MSKVIEMTDWIKIRDNGTLLYDIDLFSSEEADSIMVYLLDKIPWKQDVIRGRPLPRLNAWYSDPGLRYDYSGITHQGGTWTDQLIQIKGRVEACAVPISTNGLVPLLPDRSI